MQEDAPLYWLEVAESVPVRFGDLAQMMAAAQFPGQSERAALSQVVAEENIREQLTRMVAMGALTVRNRHGMTRLDAPIGRQLADAVLMPHDLAPLRAEFGIGIRFAPHGNGPDLWTIERAAAHVAEQGGWTDAARDTLRQQLLSAARGGSLDVRHPHTALPVPLGERDSVRDFYELVTPNDVNAWLASVEAPYRWAMPGLGKGASKVAEPTQVHGAVKHSIKTKRRDVLVPAIEQACSKCNDPSDTAQVWAQMQVLAQDEYAPLLAATPQGVKYMKNGETAYLTRDALDKRLHPEKRKAGPAERR